MSAGRSHPCRSSLIGGRSVFKPGLLLAPRHGSKRPLSRHTAHLRIFPPLFQFEMPILMVITWFDSDELVFTCFHLFSTGSGRMFVNCNWLFSVFLGCSEKIWV